VSLPLCNTLRSNVFLYRNSQNVRRRFGSGFVFNTMELGTCWRWADVGVTSRRSIHCVLRGCPTPPLDLTEGLHSMAGALRLWPMKSFTHWNGASDSFLQWTDSKVTKGGRPILPGVLQSKAKNYFGGDRHLDRRQKGGCIGFEPTRPPNGGLHRLYAPAVGCELFLQSLFLSKYSVDAREQQ
jgi:hypothetical protein